MAGPIRPEEVIELTKVVFPEEVFNVWNELIVENFDGKEAEILYSDVKAKMTSTLKGINKPFKDAYMDIEYIYNTHGWSVVFDKPAYNESYPAFYTFKKRPKAV